MSNNKDFEFKDIPTVAIVFGFIFFWPAGLVMLMLKLFASSGTPSSHKNKVEMGSDRRFPTVGTGAVPPPPPQKSRFDGQTPPVPQPSAQQTPPPPPVRSAQPQPQPQPAPQPRPMPQFQRQPAGLVIDERNTKVVSGKRVSTEGATVMMVFGAVMTFVGFLVSTIASLAFFSGSMRAYDLVTAVAVMFMVLCVPGIFMLAFGGKRRATAQRFKRYQTIIGHNKVVSMDQLAYLITVSYQNACKDIQAMIDKGYIKDAYIDWDERELVFGNPFERKRKPKTVIPAAGELSPADEIRKINEQIEDRDISDKLDRMEDITRRIFEYVDAKPDQAGRIKNFTGYYLPMTMKILHAYVRFEKQGVSGSNINTTMKDIEEILDTLVRGYENQLDSLFMDEALDVSSDISVLESMLAKEGLTGSVFDLNNLSN